MSEEEKPRRKPVKQEVLESGRILGAIARIDPELYEAIEKLAEETGEPPINVTVNLLKKYMVIQKVNMAGLNVEQLMTAFDIFDRIARNVTTMYVGLGSFFFDKMTMAMSELVEKKVEEKMKEKKPIDERFKDRLLGMLENMLEPMITDTLRMSYRAAGMPIPESLKVKVPVKITIKEEPKQASIKVE
jgi:cation diffusion facilitator CzcD-associated flavoprotein CzcO